MFLNWWLDGEIFAISETENYNIQTQGLMRDDDLQTAIIYLLSCDLYLAEKLLALAPLSQE